MHADVFNFEEEMQHLDEYWSPRIVGELNDQYIKIAKVKGEFVWHSHEHEDELFYIIQGSLDVRYQNRTVTLNKGDFHIIPKGVEHNPYAKEDCFMVLIEPKSTAHTGGVESPLTKTVDQQR